MSDIIHGILIIFGNKGVKQKPYKQIFKIHFYEKKINSRQKNDYSTF